MTLPSRLWSWLRATFRRSRMENEMDSELRFHLDAYVEDLVRSGLSREEARRRARIEFGAIDGAKEDCRNERGVRFFDTLGQDLRYALRMMRRTPAFSIIAILTLAIGIGANTGIFSVVHAVLLKPLPYPESNRLAIVFSAWGNETRGPASGPETVELQRRSRLFEEIAGIWVTTGTIVGSGEPEQIRLGQVTTNFLSLLAYEPQLGQFFSSENRHSGAQPEIVISDGLWRRQYGAEPSVIGKTVRMGAASVTVVGVMPREFRLLLPRDSNVAPDIDVFTPFPGDLAKAAPGTGYIRTIGRLRPGVSIIQAQTELDEIATQLRAGYKEFASQNLRLRVFPLQAEDVRNVRQSLLALFGGVGLVLLIACVNVANLLLSRSSVRSREITVRTALGASGGRIVRQMLTESILLSMAGGILAMAIGWGALQWLLSLRPDGIARIGAIGLDFSAFAFTAVVSILAGVLFGLAPALKAAKLNVAEALKEGDRSPAGRKTNSRSLLIVSEVALGFVLLVASGLMIRTFTSLLRVDAGFRDENALTFQLSIPGALLHPPDRADKFLHELRTKLNALPGVESVGVVSHLPLDGSAANWYSYFWRDDAPPQEKNTVMADYRSISPGYFRSVGATLIGGRDFTEFDDVAHPHAAIVDDDLAKQTWPNQNPIGKKLAVEDSPGGPFWFTEDTVEVVGVVRHVQYHSLTTSIRSQIYLPYALAPRPLVSFVVRSAMPPESLVGLIRHEVANLNKAIPVSRVAPLGDYVRNARSDSRFVTMLAAMLASIALLLATIGIYGVTSYSALQHTSQIGVRMALGAQPCDVLRMVLWQGMAPVFVGLVVGLGLALASTPLLSNMLYGVRPADFLSIGVSLVVLVTAGTAACYVPARRAMRVDPIIALRYE